MKLDVSRISSEKPVVTILTLVAALVAIIAGGVVTIVKPESLSFHQYVQDIAFMAGALGLGSGIGRGIDSYGQSVASAQQQGAPMTTETPQPPVPETPPPEPTPDPNPNPDPPQPGEPVPGTEPAPDTETEPTGGVDPHYEREPSYDE